MTELGDTPDDRDLDDGGLDLTPQTTTPAPARRRRKWLPVAVLVALGLVVVMILNQARSATSYFLNADEAIERKESLGTQTFRLQGTTVGRIERNGDERRFTVHYGGENVEVRYTGDAPPLFNPGVPIVAEGHWNEAGTLFESDKLLVKHDADYEDENPDRLDGDESNDA